MCFYGSEHPLIRTKFNAHCLTLPPQWLVGCPHHVKERYMTYSHRKRSSLSLFFFFGQFFNALEVIPFLKWEAGSGKWDFGKQSLQKATTVLLLQDLRFSHKEKDWFWCSLPTSCNFMWHGASHAGSRISPLPLLLCRWQETCTFPLGDMYAGLLSLMYSHVMTEWKQLAGCQHKECKVCVYDPTVSCYRMAFDNYVFSWVTASAYDFWTVEI